MRVKGGGIDGFPGRLDRRAARSLERRPAGRGFDDGIARHRGDEKTPAEFARRPGVVGASEARVSATGAACRPAAPRHAGVMRLLGFALGALLLAAEAAAGPALGPDVTQLIVSIAPGWDATRGTLMLLERTDEGWQPASAVVPVLYGKHGLAWGRGIAGTEENGLHKREGDGRAPAGLFALGIIYGDEPRLPDGADYPYHQVTARDAWIDDPRHPRYNQHVVIDDLEHPPAWFEKHRMRVGDPAFRWRVEIRHNADPPEPGAGSVIFFHIRRGPDRKTAGCTVMAEDDLLRMIRWLCADRKPHYLLLPWSAYEERIERWGLPPVSAVAALRPDR